MRKWIDRILARLDRPRPPRPGSTRVITVGYLSVVQVWDGAMWRPLPTPGDPS